MTRRRALRTAALTAASYQRILGANDRINVGLIGSGRRGREVISQFLKSGEARLTAIADIWDVQQQRALDIPDIKSAEPRLLNTHEELLASADIDAVLIASPDHHHLPQTLAALAANKHVYLEKPTVHRWSELKPLQDAASKSSRILQCGMQQRSGEHYLRARDQFLANKKLGDVILVRAVWHDFPWQRRLIEPRPQPANFNWKRFLGNATPRPYEWARYDSWRSYSDYGGGLLADILTHWVDVAQWLLNDPKPQSATASGGTFVMRDGRDNPDTVSATLRYSNWTLNFESTLLSVRNERPGVLLQGTEGLLEINRQGYTYTPRQGTPQEHPASGSLDLAHVRNFLAAIRGTQPLNAPLSVGIDATRPVQMALDAFRTGTRVSATKYA